MSTQATVFLEADFNWVKSLQSIWTDPPEHVDALHRAVVDAIMRDFARLADPKAESLIGKVVNGPAGSGKTHLLGTLRRRVWEQKGWFVLIDIVGIKDDFWRTVSLGFIRSLRQALPDGRSQYQAVFEAALARIPKHKKDAAVQESRNLEMGALRTVDAFVRALRMEFPEALEHSDIIRALLLQGDPDTMEIAYNWLQGIEVDVEDRKQVNLKSQPPTDHQLVRGISWLMSLAGPIMIALDQIDSIVAASNLLAEKHSEVDDEKESRARGIIHLFGDGLMGLQTTAIRSITVLACLGETWTVLREKVLKAVRDRFSSPIFLPPASSAGGQISDLIAGRLQSVYKVHGFKPPYPTWPFSPNAIAKISEGLPRKVLMLCDNFKLKCLAHDEVVECLDLGGEIVGPQPKPDASLDDKFSALMQKADLSQISPDADMVKPMGNS